ncbi:MAG: tetratricopeptide repeat protein [Deltaproteobacteria bacterium]|nr:tetratricopeptide repeat protein [Deltaproteobacteria bacterium]
MRKGLFIIALMAIVLPGMSGCIRTSEDIRLDKELGDLQAKVDLNNQTMNKKLDTEISEVRNNQVNMLSNVSGINDDIKGLRNRLDILQHRLNNIRKDLDLFTTTGGTLNMSIEQRLSALETSMTAVEAWMSFSSAYSKRAATRHTESASKRTGLSLDDAVKLFKEKKLDQARPVFERFSASGSEKEKTRAIFYLGEIAYAEKDYKTAIAHYGIIVERYPNSPLIVSSYYMIGKSFVHLGDDKNARLFFGELVSRYPDDVLAKDAKKEMKRFK